VELLVTVVCLYNLHPPKSLRQADNCNDSDLLYELAIRVDPARDLLHIDAVRSFNLEPQSNEIPGLPGALLRSGGRYAIDATKPPLSEPERRILFERLSARGDEVVRLEDFMRPA